MADVAGDGARRSGDRHHHADGRTDRRHEGESEAKDAEVSTIIVVNGRRRDRGYAVQSSVGSKVREDPREIPQSIAVISRERLEDQNIRTNAEALAQVPGFNSTNPEGFFTLRGFATGTTVDGAPSVAIAGRTDVDVEVFERIEVLKGAAALMQGRGDPGGVVNYVFKRPTNHFVGTAKLGVGSFNNYYGGLDLGGPITSDGSVRARGVAFYEDRDIFTRPEDRKRLSLYGTAQWDIGPRTTVSGGYHWQKAISSEGFRQGLPTYSDGALLDVSPRTSLSQDWNHWTKLSTSILADVEHRFGGDWIAKVAWRRGRSKLPSTVAYTGPLPGSNATNNRSTCADFQSATVGRFLTGAYAGVRRDLAYGSLRCMHTEFYNDRTGTNSWDGFVSGSIKVDGLEQKILFGYNRREELFSRGLANGFASDDFVIDVLSPDPHVRDRPATQAFTYGATTKTIDEGIYGRVTLSPIEWLKIPIGARISWVTDSLGRKIAKGEITPFMGAVVDVTKQVSLYASYAESFVPPGATQRVWPDIVPPPVTGEQYEIGAKGSFANGRVQAAAAIFQITQRNATSTDPDRPAAGGLNYVLLTGERRSRGFEAQVNGEVARGLDVGLAYAYTDAEVTKDPVTNEARRIFGYVGQAIANTPKHAVNLWANYRIREGNLEGLSVGGGLRAQSRIYGTLVCGTGLPTTSPNCPPRITAPGYATVSLRAGYDINDELNLSLNAENLFNKRYWQQLGNRAGTNYFGSPRQVQVTLRSKF